MAIGGESLLNHIEQCVVVGGRGFIGRSLVSLLLKSENWTVRIADSAPSLILDQYDQNSVLSQALLTRRASYFQVDVREKQQIYAAIRGSSVVFLMDVSDPLSSDLYYNYTLIVQGTKNVIRACRELQVKRLIYNSTSDVVFDGVTSLHNADESLPCAWKFGDVLSELKAQAESMVLFSNGGGLQTCALRPSSPFGPGDTTLIPSLLELAKSSWGQFIIGNGENMCDFTYVENVAYAHICAERALRSNFDVAGKPYFITNLEPVKLGEFAARLLEGVGHERPSIHVPVKLVGPAALLYNWFFEKLGLHRVGHQRLDLATLRQLSCTSTFNCSNAQKHIQYAPLVSLEEGLAFAIESFNHLAEESLNLKFRYSSQPSKASKLLGSGKVADILLWRDEKMTFTCGLILLFLFHFFFLSGHTFISSTAKLLLFLLVISFGYCVLPDSMLGFTIKPGSLPKLEVSEATTIDAFLSFASLWNCHIMGIVKLLCQGDDMKIFFKALLSLYFLKLLMSLSASVVVGSGLVFIFTLFYIYQQCEVQVDKLVLAICFIATNFSHLLVRISSSFLQTFLCNLSLFRNVNSVERS